MAAIFSFWGSRGAVGKTYCAFNFARCLQEELNAEILYLDANFPVSVDLKDYFTELSYTYLDTEFLTQENSADISHHNSIDVIGLCSQQMQADDSENWLTYLDNRISQLVKVYDYIVVDLGCSFSREIDLLLKRSSRIFLVSDITPASISRLSKDCDFFKKLNFSPNVIGIVINKWQSNSSLTEEWLFATLGIETDAFIPLSKLDVNSILLPSGSGKSRNGWGAFQRFVLKVEQIRQLTGEKHEGIDDKAANYTNDILEDRAKYAILKVDIHRQLFEALDLKKLDTEESNNKRKELEIQIKTHVAEILNQTTRITDRDVRDVIIIDLIKESLYLGVLEDLLDDHSVTEIMVNRWDIIYVEKAGKLTRTEATFLSEQQLMRIIERIVAPLGRRIDISSPLVDARLKDGSRVNVIIPPLAPKGSVLTIRKFAKDALTIQDLINFGTINQQVVSFLEAAVISKKNLIISGGTGTGKTTMLNILSSFIPEDERIITVEDSAELSLRQPHVITLETRPPNIEGKGEVSIRELVKNSLRMRPDRIVVGECRAGEALDMLQAMNTGHDGSMTTVHANSTGEMLSRIETLVMYAGTELPSKAIREQIRGAVHVVLQISRMRDGSRKVLQISEITGIKDGDITYENIFVYKQKGVDEQGNIYGDFVSTGYIPKCLEDFEANDITIPKEVFWAH